MCWLAPGVLASFRCSPGETAIDTPDRPPKAPQPNPWQPTRAQWTVVWLTIGLAIAGLVYRLLHRFQFNDSAAFFIGLPAVLAIAVTLTPPARSATGMVMKGMTIALLLSAWFLPRAGSAS